MDLRIAELTGAGSSRLVNGISLRSKIFIARQKGAVQSNHFAKEGNYLGF